MSSGLRGVRKRKGTSVTKCSISTRNRSKVDRLRESLNELHLEERKSKVTRNKACKNALRMEVQLHDFKFDNGISDQGTGISALTSTEIPSGRSILERRHTAVRSDVKKVNFGSSQQYGVEKSKFDMFSSGELFESDNIKTVNAAHCMTCPHPPPPHRSGQEEQNDNCSWKDGEHMKRQSLDRRGTKEELK